MFEGVYFELFESVSVILILKKFWPIIKKVGRRRKMKIDRDFELDPLKACQDQKIVADILIKMGRSLFKKCTLQSKSS